MRINRIGSVPQPSRLSLQLRQVIYQLHRPSCQSQTFSGIHSTHFSSTARDKQESASDQDATPSVRFDGLQIRSSSKLTGRPGKRRYETSEELAIDSMGSKSRVIVLRDVHEDRSSYAEKIRESDSVDDGADVENASKIEVLDDNAEPDEADVQASIEALRPQETSLHDDDFASLIKELAESYDSKQLNDYLSSMTEKTIDDTDTPGRPAIIGSWQAGRTSMDERSLLVHKRSRSEVKTKLAEAILREAWYVNISSEEQSIGELEMKVTPTQLRLAEQDRSTSEGVVPTWHTFLSSLLLIRSVEIDFHSEDNIIRITGRRSAAIEAAQEISDALASVTTLKMNFGSSNTSKSTLNFLGKGIIEDIEKTTATAIIRKRSGINVAGFDQDRIYEARRLFLRSVKWNKTEETNLNVTYNKSKRGAKAITEEWVPSVETSDDPDGRSFARLALPISKTKPDERNQKTIEETIKIIADTSMPKMDRHERQTAKAFAGKQDVEPDAGSSRSSAYLTTNWTAQLGICLHERGANDTYSSTSKTLFKHELHGLRTVLNILAIAKEATDESDVSSAELWRRKHYMVVHLVPAPAQSNAKKDKVSVLPPNLDLIFNVSDVHSWTKKVTISFYGMRTVLGLQHINVPVPERFVDIRLARRIEAWTRPQQLIKESNSSSQPLHTIVKQLEQLESQQFFETDLIGPAISVPASLIPATTSRQPLKPDNQIEYVVSHVQRRQTIHLAPSDDKFDASIKAKKPIYKSWQRGTLLSVTNVTSDKFDPWHREITLHGSRPGLDGGASSGEKLPQWQHLLRSALHLTEFATV